MKRTVYAKGIILGIIFIAAGFILGQPAHAQTPVSREYFTFHNLVRNGSFESFDQMQGIPAEWGITDPSKVSLLNDPLQVKVGVVSVFVNGSVKFTQEIRDWKGIEGSNVALGVWVKGNSGDSVKLYVDDTVNRQEKAVSLTDAQWKFVTLKTATAINGLAESLKIEIEIVPVSPEAGISLDGVMLSQVTKGVAFVPNPDDQEKSPLNLIYTDGVSGNVGIGTNTPQTALDVAGEIHASDKISVGETNEELLTSTSANEKYLNSDRDETLQGNLTVTGSVKAKGKELIAKDDIQNDFVKKTGDTILGDLIVQGLLKIGDGTTGNIQIGSSGWQDDEIYLKLQGARNFLIPSTSHATFIYSPDIFLGDGTGTSVYLRGNNIYGNNFSILADGSVNAKNFTKDGSPFNASPWLTQDSNIYYNNGNVGIGTTAPGQLLDLESSSNTAIELTSTSPSGRTWEIHSRTDGSFNIGDANAAQARFFIDSSGNVGIGTTAPTQQLELVKNLIVGLNLAGPNPSDYTGVITSKQLRLTNSSTDNFGPSTDYRILIQDTAGSGAQMVVGANKIQTSSSDLILNAGGNNVGIGTTSPTRKLHVVSNTDDVAKFDGSNTGNLRIQSNLGQVDLVAANGENPGKLFLRPATLSAGLLIDATGNVGIGTTAPDRHLIITVEH